MKIKKRLVEKRAVARILALVMMQALAIGAVHPVLVWAEEEGTYLVTITPSYKDPETGKIEDPGNNEAIGQGMTERMCGSTALLEVDGSGTMYLTVRYYLSRFIRDVTFEEREGDSYTELPYQEVQSKTAEEGASDLGDKYGYTDYRMKITSLDSVYRGKAFIKPAERNVVFFFTAKDPVAGSGDFVTGKSEDSKEIQSKSMESKRTESKNKAKTAEELQEEENEALGLKESSEEKVLTFDGKEEEMGNGSGEADDPVTGIPEKPSLTSTAPENIQNQNEAISYHLDTSYDLSQVSMEEARKQTSQMLKDAVGIVTVTGTRPEEGGKRIPKPQESENRKVMMGLFGVSAVLAAFMGLGVLRQRQGDRQ